MNVGRSVCGTKTADDILFLNKRKSEIVKKQRIFEENEKDGRTSADYGLSNKRRIVEIRSAVQEEMHPQEMNEIEILPPV